MATNTAGTQARRLHTQQEAFITAQIAYNTTGVATGVEIGTLPAGAIITRWIAHITTAFNAGTTNVLEVGMNASTYNDIAPTATVLAGTLGAKSGDPAVSTARGRLAADTPVRAIYTQSGTPASAGSAEVAVFYIIP